MTDRQTNRRTDIQMSH